MCQLTIFLAFNRCFLNSSGFLYKSSESVKIKFLIKGYTFSLISIRLKFNIFLSSECYRMNRKQIFIALMFCHIPITNRCKLRKWVKTNLFSTSIVTRYFSCNLLFNQADKEGGGGYIFNCFKKIYFLKAQYIFPFTMPDTMIKSF